MLFKNIATVNYSMLSELLLHFYIQIFEQETLVHKISLLISHEKKNSSCSICSLVLLFKLIFLTMYSQYALH